ncbi:MAG: hypothetical protein JJ971_09805 [Balneolaceae bacterium]|nr:hypothetical protein [Balneolaceae bacterium]MBO6546459.1 hypothetical protein [Balneolaceae bacterium]MBO6648818.1 hypothetical protein [Balneolaceae bacterium]
MNELSRPHSFHIPVMGTGYTIDTPIRVAHYGISSVISIIDHRLTEQMRKYYSKLYNFEYELIKEPEPDSRARRITAYLNLVQRIVLLKFDQLKASAFEEGSEITKYFEMLSDTSPFKRKYKEMLHLNSEEKVTAQEHLRSLIRPGSIDVNIMTKIDGANQRDEEAESSEFNDAHAALRGYAESNLSSSVVFSAGLNPRLYSYISNFGDFYPNSSGLIKKKVILKVSDYRSSLIQGKFLAKKGIWVSEFRIESGLNCGGHAFATDGYLMGPILREFNENRTQLKETLFKLYSDALENQGKSTIESAPEIAVTVQGGVGTSDEHRFLLEHEHADSIGWGSPFLLVPEAVSIDAESLNLLAKTGEKDYYLSNASPLGVRFNTVKGNSADIEKLRRIGEGKPGAPCIKKHLAFNTEFGEEPICTASSKFQKKKIDELFTMNLNETEFKKSFSKIIEKTCLCVGLGNGSLIEKGESLAKGTQGVAICPGPNTAYFSSIVSLKDMVDHIYGRINIISFKDRPNMFIKELQLYVSYVKEKIEENYTEQSEKQAKYIDRFLSNLSGGIAYYEQLFMELKNQIGDASNKALSELNLLKKELNQLSMDN